MSEAVEIILDVEFVLGPTDATGRTEIRYPRSGQRLLVGWFYRDAVIPAWCDWEWQ